MKRILIIALVSLALLGLAIFNVTRGARRVPREPEHSTLTVVADLPKTNNPTAPANASQLNVR